jgi:tetratricopeptide (TPR) repeat protein
MAAGIAILAVALFLLLTLRPSWWPRRELSEGARSRPVTGQGPEAWSRQAGDPVLAEGPAAKFQAELYGIVEPLVEKWPNSTHARCLLASVHRRFAREAEADRQLRQVLALDPACAEAHYSLGMTALGVSDYPLAEKHLRDAFDIDPRWADVSVQLAKAQTSQGKPRAAISTLDAYLKRNPRDAEAWCYLGQAHQKLGDFDNAKRCHLTAIDVDPECLEAHYGVAKALREVGAADEARVYFERFGHLRSAVTARVRAEKAAMTDDDFIRRAIVEMATKAGAVYAMHGDLAEAEKCWSRATALDPTNLECREMLCRLRPNDPGQWLRLGQLYIQDDRPGQAEIPFQRVIELAPQRAEGYAALAEVYVRLGKEAEKAVQLARTAVQLESTASNYFVLAAACERVEDWSGAESALTHAIELDPAEPRYREAQARLQKVRHP